MAIELFPMAMYQGDLDPIVVNTEEERKEKLAGGWKDRPTYDPHADEHNDKIGKVVAIEFQKFPCAVYHPDGRSKIARDQVKLDRYISEGWAERMGEWDERGALERTVEALNEKLDEAIAKLAAFNAKEKGVEAANMLVDEQQPLTEKRRPGNPAWTKKGK
jgi:hypothetical protein